MGLAAARIALGFVFLWAFVDKLFGLGIATPEAGAWINGGSPTTGFLKGVEGPFADFFNSLSGQAWADWLFMLGLLGIGVALLFGVAVRLATVSGIILLALLWAASLPLKTNPVIDEHVIYALLLLVIAWGLPNQRLSIAKWWQKQGFVRKNTWLW
jgi:thiosulfate dehydrogenase [quinone] large subunit